MAWQLFKDNIQRIADNPKNIDDIDQIAALYAMEYDAAIKRGHDTMNGITLAQGNVESMKQLFKIALENGRNNDDSYDLVGEMGKGVVAYWAGATMNTFPTPTIPAPGSTLNITVVSNMVINPGVWAGSMTINIPNEIPTAVILEEAIATTPTDTARNMVSSQGISALMDDYVNETPSNTQTALEAEFPQLNPDLSENISVDTNEDTINPVFIETDPTTVTYAPVETPPTLQYDPVANEYVPLENHEYTHDITDVEIEYTEEPIDQGARVSNNVNLRKFIPKVISISTGTFAYDTKISTQCRLRDLTIGTTVAPVAIISQLGLSTDNIINNLQNLAVNIVDALKTRVKGMRLNNGFRIFVAGEHLNAAGKNIMSQHYAGEAVDIQVTGYKPSDYTNLALWIQKNLPFDQLILEHGTTNWLHISCVRGVSLITGKGNRKQVFTRYYKANNYIAGIHNQYSDNDNLATNN